MLDDVRRPDASLTAEESAWVGTSAVTLFMRAMALAGVALVIGVSASLLVESTELMPEVVAASGR